MRIALGVEYDGSRFCGWQTQPQRCAVQDALERALAEMAGAPVATICAGRTDAGVHALAQVVHFDTGADRPESAWVRGVNALLPAACAVTWSRPVADDFHARYSAVTRTYRYLLLNRPVRPAADHGRVGWFHLPLDVDRMRLHHMVRTIVGCLVHVGKGRQRPEWVREVMQARDRSLAAPTFDASGLYLASVEYDSRWGLPGTARGALAEMSVFQREG
jgi:tRNA pseudouridine38-40 synthase